MKICLLRHGRTVWNNQRRYQGRTDLPLCPEGAAELVQAVDLSPEIIYVSPLLRAKQTAERLFPGVRQIPEAGFLEMDFGVFEGKTAEEMENDLVYRAWVRSGCRDACPGGEHPDAFSGRVCAAFLRILENHISHIRKNGKFLPAENNGTIKNSENVPLVIIAHGGVQMAVMERFALPERNFYQWISPNGGGFLLEWEEPLWQESRKLRYLKSLSYVRQLPC